MIDKKRQSILLYALTVANCLAMLLMLYALRFKVTKELFSYLILFAFSVQNILFYLFSKKMMVRGGGASGGWFSLERLALLGVCVCLLAMSIERIFFELAK